MDETDIFNYLPTTSTTSSNVVQKEVQATSDGLSQFTNVDAMGNIIGGDFAGAQTLTNNIKVKTEKLDPVFSPTATTAKVGAAMRYPLKPTNNHFVRFFINVDEESSMITQNQIKFTDRPVDYQDQNRISTASKGQLETNVRAANTILGGMIAASAAKHLFTGKGQQKYSTYAGIAGATAGTLGAFDNISTETLKLTKKLKRLETSITLYTPPAIGTTHSAQYELTNDKLAQLANSNLGNELINAIKHPIDTLSNAGKITGTVGRILASTNDTVSMMSRTAYNPKKDLLFKAMDNRSFAFDFQFAPQSKEEALIVKNIIFAFKLFSHPEVLKGYGQFLYLYPAEFDIEYGFIDQQGAEKTNTSLNRISSCVLESISVNYGANGSFQSLENGEPIITNMSLRFKEIETLTQERIAQGY